MEKLLILYLYPVPTAWPHLKNKLWLTVLIINCQAWWANYKKELDLCFERYLNILPSMTIIERITAAKLASNFTL